MAEEKYNRNGFRQGDDGAIFGDPSGSTGSESDYYNWDWKQIKAAVYGMSSGVTNGTNNARARSVASPQSLQDAADAFYQVQQTLAVVAKSLADQANALAGDNGPWKGAAADSFLDRMATFSKQVRANAEVLSGGSTGSHSVPQQLADNAVNLTNAQNKLAEIDIWYANQARQQGVTPMADGLIPISAKPHLVRMMTDDMRAVLKSLAGEYQVTIDAVRSPNPVSSPVGRPDLGSLKFSDHTPGTGVSPLPGISVPGSLAPKLPGLPSSDTVPSAGLRFPAANAHGIAPNSSFDPVALDKALNPGVSGLDGISPFPGGTGVGAPNVAGGLGPMDASLLPPRRFGGGTGTGGTGSLPRTANLASIDPAKWGDTFSPAKFPGGTSVGGPGSTVPKVGGAGSTVPKVGGGAGLHNLAGFPGGTSTKSGIPSSLHSDLPNKIPALESRGLPKGLEASFPGDTGVNAGLSASGAGGMPFMPGMGGMGGAPGSGAGAGERSDASGLLDPSGEPWAGEHSVGNGEPGSGLGAAPGGEGLNLPHAAEFGVAPDIGAASALSSAAMGGATSGSGLGGMPFMPGMGAGPGAANGNVSGERSDASGLLESSAEPWTGDVDAPDTEITGGDAPAGGTGLTLSSGITLAAPGTQPVASTEGTAVGSDGKPITLEPGAMVPSEGDAGDATAGHTAPDQSAAAQIPGIAMMATAATAATAATNAAPNGNGRTGERPDGSGLLAGVQGEWHSEEPVASAEEAGQAAEAAEAAVHGGVPAVGGGALDVLPVTGFAIQSEPEGEAPQAQRLVAAGERPDAPMAVAQQPDSEGAEDTSAWDAAGASIAPLLWTAPGRDGLQAGVPGSPMAEDSPHGNAAAVVPGIATAAETPPGGTVGDAQQLSTWRPSRSAAAGAGAGAPASSYEPMACGDGSFDPHEADEETVADSGQAAVQAEPARKAISDLLVQEESSWGATSERTRFIQ